MVFRKVEGLQTLALIFSNVTIPKLYAQTRDVVSVEIKSTEFLTATTDMWSSYTTEPYLSYTVYFVGEDWKLESQCLQTLYLPEDHTGENIAAALRETLESWECFKAGMSNQIKHSMCY